MKMAVLYFFICFFALAILIALNISNNDKGKSKD